MKNLNLEKLENDVIKFKVEGKACYQIYNPEMYERISSEKRNEEKKKIIQQEIANLEELKEILGYEVEYSFTVDRKHRVWVMRDFIPERDLETFKELEDEKLQVH